MDMTPDQEPNASGSGSREPEPPHDPAANQNGSFSGTPSAFAPAIPGTGSPSPTGPAADDASAAGQPQKGSSEAATNQVVERLLGEQGPQLAAESARAAGMGSPDQGPDEGSNDGPDQVLAQRGEQGADLQADPAKARDDSGAALSTDQLPPKTDLGRGDVRTAGSTGQSSEVVRTGGEATASDSSGASSTTAKISSSEAPGAPGTAIATSAEGSAGEIPGSRTHSEPAVGWFSAEPGTGQYSEALSERLSAERPGDEPAGHFGPEEAAGGGRAHPGLGLTPIPEGQRGPELIEVGMVHVDPDPEIGSPTHAAGWAEHPIGQAESKEGRARSGPAGHHGAVVPEVTHANEAAGSSSPASGSAADPGATALESHATSGGGEPVVDQAQADADTTAPEQRIAADSDLRATTTHGEGADGIVPRAQLGPDGGTEAEATPSTGPGAAEPAGATVAPPTEPGTTETAEAPVTPSTGPGAAETTEAMVARSTELCAAGTAGAEVAPSTEPGATETAGARRETEAGRAASSTVDDSHDRSRVVPSGPDAASAGAASVPPSASDTGRAAPDADSSHEDRRGGGSLDGLPDSPAPSSGTAEPAGTSATGVAVASSFGPSGEEVPWNEPALPMAWPPGGAPPVHAGPPATYEAPAEDELAPPDPSWPRLFGRVPEGQDAAGAKERGRDPAPHEPTVDSAGVVAPSHTEERSGPSSTAAWNAVDAPADGLLAMPTGEGQGAGRHDTGEREPTVLDSTKSGDGPRSTNDSTSSLDRPAIVVLTSDGPEAPRSPQESSEAGQREGPSGRPADKGAPSSHGAISSTSVAAATRAETEDVAETQEVDVRDASAALTDVDVSRETSAGGGEGMEQEREDGVEDEASIAVREAVTRAAAEAGVDVSRETNPLDPGVPMPVAGEESIIDTETAARNARVTFRIHPGSTNGTRRVLAVANQKGGVGKSTTAVNIGAYLALAGARVLVVDLDPQGNASTGLGLDHRDIEPSIYDVLTGDLPPAEAIRATGVANLHVLPSTIDLAGAEVELASAMSRETRLRRALQSIDHQYDTILVDCPPSLGLLTVNALAAADELLIPIQCEYYALEGLGQLLRNVELVRAHLNPQLRIGGIVLTMYDGRTRLALQVVDEVRRHFTDVVYQTVVPRSVRLSEAPGYGVPIALYDPLSRGGIAYRDLTFELAERSGLLAPTGEGAN